VFYITIQKIIKKRLAYKDIIRYLYSVIKTNKKENEMKNLTVKTPTGKDVEISFDGSNYTINIPDANLNQTTDYIRLSKSIMVKQLGKAYPTMLLDKPIVIDTQYYDLVNNFIREIENKKSAEKLAKLNVAIPGYSRLLAAYDYRSEQLEINRNYMERAYQTSIGSGNQGDVDEAEAKVAELENEYPIANMYIYWINRDPSSNFGYQANKAAEALFCGASIENANKIANDFDQNF